MPLPGNVGSGEIVGNFSEDNIAGVDITKWEVDLVPSARQFIDATSTPPSVAFLKPVYTGRLDADGNLFAKEPGPGDSYLPFMVPASNDPDLNPIDFTFKVTYRFPGLGSNPKSFHIAVPEGDTIDLVTVTPVEPSNGTPVGGGGGGGGLPAGGAAGQILIKVSAVDGAATWQTLDSSKIVGFDESVDDRVAALLAAGPNVTLSYNDVTNQIVVSAEPGGVQSDPTGIPGASSFTNMVRISETDYQALPIPRPADVLFVRFAG